MDATDVVERVDILEYISQYVELENQNGDWFGSCPFHAENTPSFSVSPSSSLFYCFGCHLGGDILTFIQRYHKVGFKQSLQMAAAYAGITEETFGKRLTATSALKRMFPNKSACKSNDPHQVLPETIMDRYDPDMKNLSAWLDEGISEETLTRFNVRFDAFNNRIVLPIRNPHGDIINICARAMDPEWKRKKLRKYTYYYPLGNLDTFFGLYENKHGILKQKEIILVEGAKSVMLLSTWGIENSVAALTSTISDEQLLILISLGVRVVITFDADVDPREDKKIQKLKRFVRVDWVKNRDILLEEKMAPVDKGLDTWLNLYERREKLN